MSVIFETQKAVYSQLTGNVALMLAVNGIYDHVPENAAFPYITIGELALEDNSIKGAKGFLFELVVNVYSRVAGRKQVLEIIEKIVDLLDRQALAVAGSNHIMTSLETASSLLHKDGITRQGKIIFKINVR